MTGARRADEELRQVCRVDGRAGAQRGADGRGHQDSRQELGRAFRQAGGQAAGEARRGLR